MKSIQALEPYITVMDAITSSQWSSTIVQLLRAAGSSLYYHSFNVALITANLALFGNRKILSENGISFHSLVLGAFLHDVGYIGSASTTACGKSLPNMDYAEQIIFHEHIRKGLEQVRQHTDDPVILDIISMHHEYLNGSGFPEGKKGDELPPHVRLVSIADALSSYIENAQHDHPDRISLIVSDLQNYLKNESITGKFDLSIIDNFFHEIISYYQSLSPLHSTLHSCFESGTIAGKSTELSES